MILLIAVFVDNFEKFHFNISWWGQKMGQICFTSHWPHCDNISQTGFTRKNKKIKK
jgi:hypothetical protein